jgi:uncharacterized membrane protein YedE/YeeE
MRLALSLISGVLFGLGLIVSGMINPAKIIAFLGVGGEWDPSLAVVMASALLVTCVGYRVVLMRNKPVFEQTFSLPARTEIDGPLLTGAAMFGVGWGLSGLCPGPAIAGAPLGAPQSLIFVGALVAGMLLKDTLAERRARAT